MESDSTIWRFEGLFNLPMMLNKKNKDKYVKQAYMFLQTELLRHQLTESPLFHPWVLPQQEKLPGASLTAWWAQRQTAAKFLPSKKILQLCFQATGYNVNLQYIYCSHLWFIYIYLMNLLFPSVSQYPTSVKKVLPICQVNNICLLLWWHAAANHGSEHVAGIKIIGSL